MALIVLTTNASFARWVTDETGRHVNVPEHPERLISLAPSITETLYALGLGSKIVGDTDYCDYPPAAKLKPHVGALLNPSLERIVALRPDLVLGTPEANRREIADQLQRLGIPIYGVTAHSVDGVLKMIQDLGQVLDCEPASGRLVQELRKRIQNVEQRVRNQSRPTVLFVVWYQPLITAGPHSFIADVIRRAGGVPMGGKMYGEWPHISMEEVVRQNPDVILFPKTRAFSPTLNEFRHLPGWKDLRAVKDHRMYFVSDAINHPSPRLIDALEQVADILHPSPPGANKPGGRR